ncbi:MFS transporter [Parageobacillus thermoglucosidasius]|uniref:MFS transporter n=1 Tax=Parageobacillus thermoglucosidasius TaxID=1426 RepID=UPI0009B67BC8|nr:MFS transporter [Parageobacillus thermoglucosidasius]MED4906370.1 MFS transporter [Parageobacillus thermoglucosidasius]MED4915867.1 MFS transporter [Parageobacillus thermoglucosidasius]MED4946709.1 MFS transporter [Parageobacillus thermoglucosidasius]MED4982928.1 MFS transporter [Parageobacillus thermoglucosidasius]RDE28493.1 MFS transporter [Parageobacillus thermoglucosidasius]
MSVVSGALFLFVETRVKNPLLDFSIFKNRLYVSGLVSNFLSGILLMGTLILLPLFLIKVKEFSTLEASFVITSLSGVMLIVAPITGRAIDKIGYLIPMLIGYITIIVGFSLLINIDVNVSVLKLILFLAILGTGLGIIMITSVTVCTATVSQTQISLSSGIFATVRSVGGAIGVALFVSLTLSFLNHYSANVVDEGVTIIKESDIPKKLKDSIQKVLMKQRDTFFEEKNNNRVLELDEESKQLLAKNIEKEALAKIPKGTSMSPEMQKKIEEQVKQQLINIDKNIANIKKQIEDISKEYVAKSMAKAFFSGIILCFLSSLSLPFLSKKFSLSHSREVDI